ncbi:MAG TPA: type I-E CRISPR-associated protein Cas5/CasD [Candidatus Kapabacteria bacterium]|nr:type I-E CRISPR-associated protein Cas5/CasD [Candidatus Kapabacteria bacterium]
MSWTLLLRLAGPMQAWGVQSRFEVRDTGTEPSKSGVIGLVCAALGIDRSDPIPEEIRSLRMGVRVDREGQMRRDYQTTVRWAADRRTKGWKPGGTTLSERYYLADASFLVGLEGEDADLLARIADALDHPHWPLCLGRRACPPSRPIRVQNGLREGALENVLAVSAWEDCVPNNDDHENDNHDDTDDTIVPQLRTVIEVRGTVPDGLMLLRRPDQPVSFEPRHFDMRDVVVLFIPNPSVKEVADVR